jgi:hypothetical protein
MIPLVCAAAARTHGPREGNHSSDGDRAPGAAGGRKGPGVSSGPLGPVPCKRPRRSLRNPRRDRRQAARQLPLRQLRAGADEASQTMRGRPRRRAVPGPGASAPRPGNPRPGESGPRFPIPGRIGNRGFPVSRPNRESGIPSPIPGKKIGNRGRFGASDSRFPSESEHQPQWTRNILSREYHASALTGSMRLLFRVREREHAAVICLPRLRKVTSSGSRNSVFRQWILVVDVPWHQSFGRHRPQSPSHSPPSPCPSRPPSAGRPGP